MSSYDISRAFKRIENDLMDSMMRNLKRHQAEENELGFEWEQWQALQLKELERYRKENADKFTDDFSQINKKVEAMFKATCNDAQSKQENYILEQIKKGDFTPTQTKDTQFFNLNDDKLNLLIERTKSDFSRAEYAMLRKADDVYRQVIFDAQVYANVTNDYAKAVDMATKDFLMKGIQCVTYKNGAKHNIADYAEMAIRTGNKRAYLMGEGNAHDKYGIHTVRVNKRTQACPKCVGFLGRVLVDDVYGGGTRQEALKLNVPTLSDAIQAGFLHPNCKDIYSLYMEGISRPATPWTQEEINEIVGDYNKEQAITHAVAMAESYRRLSKYALDPTNAQLYGQRADVWEDRATELGAEPPKPVEPPTPVQTPEPTDKIRTLRDQIAQEKVKLREAQKEENIWDMYMLSYSNSVDVAEIFDKELDEYLEDEIKEALEKYKETKQPMWQERAERYKQVKGNKEELEQGKNGKHYQDIKARINQHEDEIKRLESEIASTQQQQRTVVTNKNNLRELPYKKITEPETAEQLLSKINPNYPNEGYTRNCQRTVIAEELRYRGYDVVAKPRSNDALGSYVLRAFDVPKNFWEDPEFTLVQKKSLLKDIEAQFDKWGDDARAILRVKWDSKHGSSGHFVFVRKENGSIIIEDPQSNKIRDAKDLASKITQSSKQNWIIRVDNREVNNLVDLAVEDRQ